MTIAIAHLNICTLHVFFSICFQMNNDVWTHRFFFSFFCQSCVVLNFNPIINAKSNFEQVNAVLIWIIQFLTWHWQINWILYLQNFRVLCITALWSRLSGNSNSILNGNLNYDVCQALPKPRLSWTELDLVLIYPAALPA